MVSMRMETKCVLNHSWQEIIYRGSNGIVKLPSQAQEGVALRQHELVEPVPKRNINQSLLDETEAIRL